MIALVVVEAIALAHCKDLEVLHRRTVGVAVVAMLALGD